MKAVEGELTPQGMPARTGQGQGGRALGPSTSSTHRTHVLYQAGPDGEGPDPKPQRLTDPTAGEPLG